MSVKMMMTVTVQKKLEAYQSIGRVELSLQKKAILTVLEVHGTLSDEEIAHYTGLKDNTVRPRRGELWAAGHIEIGEDRVTNSGRKATGWRIKQ